MSYVVHQNKEGNYQVPDDGWVKIRLLKERPPHSQGDTLQVYIKGGVARYQGNPSDHHDPNLRFLATEYEIVSRQS